MQLHKNLKDIVFQIESDIHKNVIKPSGSVHHTHWHQTTAL